MLRTHKEQERFVIAVPAGPREPIPNNAKHHGSRLAPQIHRLLRNGLGFRYELPNRKLYGHVNRQPIGIAEFTSSNVPEAVADGAADAGIVGSDDVLNLPDDQLRRIIIMPYQLGFGDCNFHLGVPVGRSYSADTRLEDLMDTQRPDRVLVLGTSLDNLLQRIIAERGVGRASLPLQPRRLAGHVENAVRYFGADAVADITTTGGTMRQNGLVKAEHLASFTAVFFVSRELNEAKEGILTRIILPRLERALRRPQSWILQEEGSVDRNQLDSGNRFSGVSLLGRFDRQREVASISAISTAMMVTLQALGNPFGVLNSGSNPGKTDKR